MKKIYAEWKLNGVFYNDFFYSWDAFHDATFSPDCDILLIKEWKL